jgi:HK97 family phage prohead protease
MKDIFQYKNVSEGFVKDIDEAKGIVTGYFSSFGVVDSDNDMIMPGAYKKTLNENSKRIKHLWQHDVRYPLAKPMVLKEDSFGLYFESEIAHTTYGKDVLELYKGGVVDEHSIGFKTEKKNEKKDYTEITEVKLWEGSTVTFGANENTPFTGMKGMNVEDVIKKMDNVWKAFRNGKFETDEIFENLEIYHKQLQQLFIDLTKSTKAADEALEPEKKGDESLAILEAVRDFSNNLKTATNGS